MIIDLATVKIYLGLNDTTYDAKITQLIPDVDALVKLWCRKQFADDFTATTTASSDILSIANYTLAFSLTTPKPILMKVGDIISGDGITTGSYVTRLIYTGRVLTGAQISAVATASGTVTLVRGFNRAYQETVSKIIGYKLSKMTLPGREDELSSRTLGPLSETFINKTYLIPQSYLDSLPRYPGMT